MSRNVIGWLCIVANGVGWLLFFYLALQFAIWFGS